MSQAALKSVLAQLEMKDRACASLANELRLSRAYCVQETKRLDALRSKKQHFVGQTTRLVRLVELTDARSRCGKLHNFRKVNSRKLKLASSMRVRLEETARASAEQAKLLGSMLSKTQIK